MNTWKPGASCLLILRVDAVFVVAGVHAKAIRDALATGKVKLIGLGEPLALGSEVDGFRLSYPFIRPHVIPVGTYETENNSMHNLPPRPISTLAVTSVLICTEDFDERAAYQITRSIFHHRAFLIKQHSVAGQIHEPELPTNLSFPLHPGAEQFYRRHEPNFFVKYAEVIALLMSVVMAAWGSILAIRKWLLLKKKDRIDEYYVKIDRVLDRLHGKASYSTEHLLEFERELSALRKTAVQDLVRERLTAGESFRIFQTLLANSEAEVRRQLDFNLASKKTPPKQEKSVPGEDA